MGKREDISKLGPDMRELVNLVSRHAAVEIMNDLAEAGPEWGGEFKNSWKTVAVGQGASGSTEGSYPYDLNDIPNIAITVRETARAKKFVIENSQPYAAYALDLEVGEFKKVGRPKGKVVKEGERPKPGFRGDLNGTGEAESTAELDWYSTYVNSEIKEALRRGVAFGFKAKP